MRKRRKRRVKKRVLIPLILLAVSVALMAASVYVDGFADWHTEHIYPALTGSIGRIFGLVPTSVAEIGLYLFVLTLIFGFLYILLSIIHKTGIFTGRRRQRSYCCGHVSVLAFLYVINCGINYRSTSFAERSGILPRDYTVDELRSVCLTLTQAVQDTEPSVTRDDDGSFFLQPMPERMRSGPCRHWGKTTGN